MTTINREYLENLCLELKENYPVYKFERGGRIASNMYNLGNDIYYFEQHNFLPDKENDILNGHYTIVVNTKTFHYFIFQHANFGGLTYTTESKDKAVYFKNDLPKNSRIRMDFIISDALLGFYFYDGNHINHQGKNLFPTANCNTIENSNEYWETYNQIEKRSCIFDKHEWEEIQILYAPQIEKLMQQNKVF